MKNNFIIMFFLLLLIFPFSVYSEEKCDINSLKLENIKINNKSNNVDENKNAVIENNNVKIDLKMYDVDDYIEYKITAKNDSKSKYYIGKESLNSSTDYLNYEINTVDNSEVIEPNETKTIILKITYKNEISNDNLKNGLYDDKKIIDLNFDVDEDLSNFINPTTGFGIQLVIVLILLLVSVILFLKLKKKVNIDIFILFLGLNILIPLVVHAETCSFNITIDCNVIIDERDATFESGSNVNLKMKMLAGNDVTQDNKNTVDSSIKKIMYSENEPDIVNKEEKNIVSVAESEYPIYMWFDEGVIYWWSEAYHPKLNVDASNMFRQLTVLTDISGLSQMDISHVENLNYIFVYDSSMSDYDSISNWDSSNVTSMQAVFAGNTSLEDISFLENWNTSSVIDMKGLFQFVAVSNLKPLKNWNTSNVITMRSMFALAQELKTLEGLENWDTSNVTSMYGMFMGGSDYLMKIEDITSLRNWNVSNVQEMQGMFQANVLLSDLSPLLNWNTSSVVNMQNMFTDDYSLTNLNGLEKWNFSSVTNISKMFLNCIRLENVSAISNWNVSNVETMEKLFYIDPEVAVAENKYSELSFLDISKWNMLKVNNYSSFLKGQEYISTEFTIRNNATSYSDMLKNVATKGGNVTVNYTADTESLVDNMIATKSEGANVIKGRLVE